MAMTSIIEPIYGTNYRYFGTAAPGAEEIDKTFLVGDEVINTVPAGGGASYRGWVCTTAGAGGTAVFKGFALIQV